MKLYTLLFAVVALTFSCSNDDDTVSDNDTTIAFPNVAGMNYTLSDRSFSETYSTLRNALNDNPNIEIVAEVDHQQNATSVGEELNPSRVIFFGNPSLGTPLMQANQQAGLDLPQRILIYQDANDDVFVAYNNINYIASRHGVGDVTTLSMIAEALNNLSTAASNNEIVSQNTTVSLDEDVISTVSEQGFLETYDSLINEITNNTNLTIIAEVDHSENATSEDLDLLPTRLVIFGNPELGTTLMQNSQTTALDLPQKMLVYQNDIGAVVVAFNSTSLLVNRHDITDNEEILQTILDTLQNLADTSVVND